MITVNPPSKNEQKELSYVLILSLVTSKLHYFEMWQLLPASVWSRVPVMSHHGNGTVKDTRSSIHSEKWEVSRALMFDLLSSWIQVVWSLCRHICGYFYGPMSISGYLHSSRECCRCNSSRCVVDTLKASLGYVTIESSSHRARWWLEHTILCLQTKTMLVCYKVLSFFHSFLHYWGCRYALTMGGEAYR